MSVRRDKRKSLIYIQPATPKGDVLLPTESFGINDDEVERRERERLRKQSAANEMQSTLMGPPKQPSGIARLAKMTLAERNDHIEKCVQLSAENKISTKNAFSLLLIDQMMDQIKKETSNFQLASTQLDASAKIYACRVDKVHTEAMRIAGGLIVPDAKAGKKKTADDTDDEDVNTVGDNEDLETPRSKTKKKKNRKDIIVKDRAALNSPANTSSQNNSEGFLHELITSPEASEPGNCYFMSNFEVTNSACELMVLAELLSYRIEVAEDLSDPCNLQVMPLPKLSLSNITEHPMCPELNSLLSDVSSNHSVPIVDEDDDDVMDFHDDCDINDDDEQLDDNLASAFNDDHAVESEMAPVACRPVREPTAVVDFYDSISSQLLGPLQYSLIHRKSLNLMGGPEHWKVGQFSTSRPSDQPKKAAAKKRVKDPVNLEYVVDELMCRPIMARHNNMLTKRTVQQWSLLKLPDMIAVEDEYNMSRFEKMWLRDKVPVYVETGVWRESTDGTDVECMDYDDDGCEGDDGNDSFDDDRCGDEGEPDARIEEDDLELSTSHRDENAIPYAMRAKKIDMKLLKATIWTMIKLADPDNDKENMVSDAALPIRFSQLYRDLPAKLSPKMVEALTPHLAILAILHLANEESLFLKDQPDLLDFTITYG